MADESDKEPTEPPRDPERAPRDPERKRRLERAVPEVVKRLIEKAVETGVERLSEQPEKLKDFLADLRLPKEVISEILSHVDDTKNGLYRVVAKEIRDVLAQTELADEIAKVLTKLSFEIKTEIRFVPNDRAKETEQKDETETAGVERPALPKPRVTAEVNVRDRSKEGRR
jgi:hypothetical protein